MDARKVILRRIYLVFLCVCLFGIAILVQVFRLQFVQGSYWKSKADSLQTDYRTIDAARGNIFSDNGSLLATSVPIYDIRMDVACEAIAKETFEKSIDSLAYCLSNLFKDKSQWEYKKDLRDARRTGEHYHLIRRDISYEQLQAVKQFPLFRLGKYKGGLITVQKEQRELPFDQLAQRTIGLSREGVKPVGIEGAFDTSLKGVSGKRLMQRMAGNVWMPITDNNEIEPKDGNDLITTIDVNIQDVAEHALLTQLGKNDADHGCLVLMEVQTGEIKAIANLKKRGENTYEEDYNYAIAEATEPGSTMKLASLLVAMDDGFADPNDTVDIEGGVKKYADRILHDSHEGGPSRMTLQHAFEISSNVGISKIIYNNYKRNPASFVNGLQRFHVDKPLGLQITGEAKPRVKMPTDKDWYVTTLPYMSIGYDILLSPMQTLTLYNAVANNGRMVKPKFVKEIRNHGALVTSFPTEVISESIASPGTIQNARRMLEGVVERGTATNLKAAAYAIAGKTGTAQISQGADGYKGNGVRYQASFVGYFPADNPKYTCIVVVNAPSAGVYYGNVVAGSIFKEVSDKVYATRLDMHPELGIDSLVIANHFPYVKAGSKKETAKAISKIGIPVSSLSEDAEWVSASITDEAIELKGRKHIQGTVPNVVGMGLQDAVYLLEESGLQVKVNGRGMVQRQSLDAGMKVSRGSQITIELI